MCFFYICTMNAELCLNSIYAVEAMFVGVFPMSSKFCWSLSHWQLSVYRLHRSCVSLTIYLSQTRDLFHRLGFYKVCYSNELWRWSIWFSIANMHCSMLQYAVLISLHNILKCCRYFVLCHLRVLLHELNNISLLRLY